MNQFHQILIFSRNSPKIMVVLSGKYSIKASPIKTLEKNWKILDNHKCWFQKSTTFFYYFLSIWYKTFKHTEPRNSVICPQQNHSINWITCLLYDKQMCKLVPKLLHSRTDFFRAKKLTKIHLKKVGNKRLSTDNFSYRL